MWLHLKIGRRCFAGSGSLFSGDGFWYISKKIYMKIKLLFIISFFSAFSLAQSVKKVFFVGNSYTAFNNLPQLVQNIAVSTGDNLVYEAYTPGGNTLKQHATNPAVTSTIDLGTWDYVVLQEQSQIPAFPLPYVQAELFPYGAQLVTRIRNSNPCGNAIFYMTWGRKNGDASNCSPGSYMCTYTGMDDKISERYMHMALENEALVSPVGKVWRWLRTNYPNMELYETDESHPSEIGSMVAAYTFYTTIFKKDPLLATYNGNISAAEAQIVRTAVHNVVFNNMNTYYILSHDVNSRFSTSMVNSQTVQFQNESSPSATTYFWDFGDGTTSTLENPQHSYAATGNYTVSFTTNACGRNTTATKNIEILALGVEESSAKPFLLYPNPVEKFLKIQSRNRLSSFQLFDASGRRIETSIEEQYPTYTIDMQRLTKGLYFLKFTDGAKQYSEKIQKK